MPNAWIPETTSNELCRLSSSGAVDSSFWNGEKGSDVASGTSTEAHTTPDNVRRSLILHGETSAMLADDSVQLRSVGRASPDLSVQWRVSMVHGGDG